ncbi:MAG TPA: hypothetical protein VFA58_04700 [Chthoniobacterales bacterium]|nr:hypothetical protein [Chthoniobacterales bacterium]
MKIMVACAVFFSFAIVSAVYAQSAQDIFGQPAYATQSTGIGTTSKSASGAGANPEATPDQSRTAEHDDALYRGRTDEMESQLLRDDGMLHFKSHGKEKALQVDSLKSLQSSGTDAKFQGDFATSGVSSIDKVASKSFVNRSQEPVKSIGQTPPSREESGVIRHMKFPAPEDSPKNGEADSSPSPTASPTSSPAAKKDEAKK